MSRQLSAVEKQVESLKTGLVETKLALEKLMDESAKTETDLRAVLSVVQELLLEEKWVSIA